MSTAQRKRKSTNSSNSRTGNKRRIPDSTSSMASVTEPIELESGEEVVDLTCESSEPVVVDLTHNDSVVIVEDTPNERRHRSRNSQQTDSCILSSDDEESRDADVFVTSKVSRALSSSDHNSSRLSSGRVSCPICMDGYSEIVQSGRLIVSTKCGHVFCSQCLRDALKNATSCPTCRKKLTHKQYHPIYI